MRNSVQHVVRSRFEPGTTKFKSEALPLHRTARCEISSSGDEVFRRSSIRVQTGFPLY
jgi:hypothetical protein